MTAQETRRRTSNFGVLQRMLRERFYIAFNCRGAWRPERRRHDRYVWPKLFHSREQAERAMKALPIFSNREATAGRGRIVSASVERVLVRA